MAVACPKSGFSSATQWYVVKVKPHKEAYVELQLRTCANLDTYCPLMKTARRYLRKWQKQVEPVFPGYVFVRMQIEADMLHLRRLHGYDSLVRFGGRPAAVPGQFITEFRGRENRAGYIVYRPARTLRANETVKIVDGLFRGKTGRFLRYNDSAQRACLLLEMMNSQTQLELPAGAVETLAV